MTNEEQETLIFWERADNVLGYVTARVLRLSGSGWDCKDIAEPLGLDIDSVRRIINDFNLGGIAMVAPRHSLNNPER